MKKVYSAVVLCGLFTSLNANTSVFGSIGAIVNSNMKGKGSERSALLLSGVKANIAVDFASNIGHFGLGIMTGYGPYEHIFNDLEVNKERYPNDEYGRYYYRKPFIDISDLYYGIGNMNSYFIIGRYNSSEYIANSDWLGGYSQGLAFAFLQGNVEAWGTWINDYMNTGYNASYDYKNTEGRSGLDLQSFVPFNSTIYDFEFRVRDIFAGGLEFNYDDKFKIGPFGSYWFRKGYDDVIQAGLHTSITIGDTNKSITTLRILWQNEKGEDDYSIHSMLLWGDQEIMVRDVFKFGGGYISVGDKGVLSLIDRTRFYGQFLSPSTLYRVSNGREYLNPNFKTHYAFTGFGNGKTWIDLLYADGDYSEASIVMTSNIYRGKAKWDIGGGLVTRDTKLLDANAILFTKVSF